jgi:hypothetical protein
MDIKADAGAGGSVEDEESGSPRKQSQGGGTDAASMTAADASRIAEHAEKVAQLEAKLASTEISATTKYGLKKQLAIAKATRRKLTCGKFGKAGNLLLDPSHYK